MINISNLSKIENNSSQMILKNFEIFKIKKEIRYFNLMLKYLYNLYSSLEEKIDEFKSCPLCISDFMSLYEMFEYSVDSFFSIYNQSKIFYNQQDLLSFRDCIHFDEKQHIFIPLNMKFQKLDMDGLLNKTVSPILYIKERGKNDI